MPRIDRVQAPCLAKIEREGNVCTQKAAYPRQSAHDSGSKFQSLLSGSPEMTPTCSACAGRTRLFRMACNSS